LDEGIGQRSSSKAVEDYPTDGGPSSGAGQFDTLGRGGGRHQCRQQTETDVTGFHAGRE